MEGFNAVQAMREISEKLSERYWKYTNILKTDRQKIGGKYNFRNSK